MQTIKEGLNKAYKKAGSNAYFGNGFMAGVEFAQKWIPIDEELPEEVEKIGIPVLVKLAPKIDGRKRVYGDIVRSVFYKDKFHWEFNKGKIQDVTHWMLLPDLPK